MRFTAHVTFIDSPETQQKQAKSLQNQTPLNKKTDSFQKSVNTTPIDSTGNKVKNS